MNPWALLLSFAPWLILKIISDLPFGNPLTMLQIAIVTATLVSLYQSRKSTVRGFIYWGNLFFFALSLLLVVILPQAWFITKMGLFSQLMLNFITWGSILFKKPFTLDYAKEHVPQELWNHPVFLQKNYIITGVWGCYFLLGFLSAEIRIYEPGINRGLIEIFDNVAMLGAVFFTSFYSKHKKVPRGNLGGGEAGSSQTKD